MLIRIASAAAVVAAVLLTAGCASQSSEPYALTGRSPTVDAREQARWTDDKGHYRPEWRAGINRPVGYPKQVP